MSSKFKLNLAIILTIIFWASAYVGIRAALKEYSPGSMALLRFAIASLCMGVIYYKSGQAQKLTLWQICQVVFVGILGFTIYHIALNYGELTVQAGIACFIVSQVPVLITILSVLFLSERLTIGGWFGTVISVIGLVIIAWSSKVNAHLDIGIIYVLIAAIASCMYTILQKPLLKNIHPITFTSYSIWGGTLFLGVFTPRLIHELPYASLATTGAVIYLGIFPGAIAYLLWGYALKQHSATKIGSILYVIPLCTMLMGWLLLGELPNIVAIAGGLLTLLGAFLVSRGAMPSVREKG